VRQRFTVTRFFPRKIGLFREPAEKRILFREPVKKRIVFFREKIGIFPRTCEKRIFLSVKNAYQEK
jgi:hypothetical protein